MVEISNSYASYDLLEEEHLRNISSVAIPSGNLTFDICHIFSINKNIAFEQIAIGYETEIDIYIHDQQQFLSVWKNQVNVISSSAPSILPHGISDQKNIYDLEVNVLMSRFNGIGFSGHDKYDECVKKLTVFKNHTIKDIIELKADGQYLGKLSYPMNMNNKIFNTLLADQKACKEATSKLEIQAIPQRTTKITKINKETGNSVLSLKMSDKLKFSSKKRPKVVLKISKVSKIVQVTSCQIMTHMMSIDC